MLKHTSVPTSAPSHPEVEGRESTVTFHILSSREFTRDVSAAKRAAYDGPVFITDRGAPAHVLLTIEEYERLAATGPNLVQLLAMTGGADIEFDPPRPGSNCASPTLRIDAPSRHQRHLRVVAKFGGLASVQDFYRLYMIPGKQGRARLEALGGPWRMNAELQLAVIRFRAPAHAPRDRLSALASGTCPSVPRVRSRAPAWPARDPPWLAVPGRTARRRARTT